MLIWIVFASLAAAVVAVLCWPLWRGERDGPARALFDQAVFKDQLTELDRDAARGVIAQSDAEAARNEIARRLIAAGRDDQSPQPSFASRRYLVLPVAALVPVLALSLYALEGKPHLQDVPLAWRLDNAVENNDFVALVAKAERRLAANPDDAQGWSVLAPAYRRLERYADAARAYGALLRINGPDSATYAERGEMLTFAAGSIDKDAASDFAELLKLDPKNPKARFYQGYGLKQQGKATEALAIWQSLRDDTRQGDPWLPLLEQEMASLAPAAGAKAPVLTDEQMQAGAEMSEGDRQAMIQSMVEGLEQRLKDEPGDLEGWQRLMRARTVLGETEKAKSAYETARTQFKDKPEAVAALSASARELGIE